MGLLLLKLSEALRRENMARASGKLGGVAGVLAGVHIWKQREKQFKSGTGLTHNPQFHKAVFLQPCTLNGEFVEFQQQSHFLKQGI